MEQSELDKFTDFAKILAFGKHPTLSPPFKAYQDSDNDILSFYHSFFEEYLSNLKTIGAQVIEKVNAEMHSVIETQGELKINFDIITEVKTVCNAILDATTQYFKGFPALAYDEFEKAMTRNHCHLLELLPQLLIEDNILFYRVRKGINFQERKDLFHTPFEKRVKCNSYRFSTLGYPSLYLASTLETALLESDVKNPEEYSCACFKPTHKLTFIDLALPDRKLEFWEQYSLVVFYPLIMACNLKVKEKDEPFKPEYIIPQLLVQTIRLHSQNLDGITYTSTKHENICYTSFDQRDFIMYIPSAEQEKGYSQKLAEKLISTKPMPCDVKNVEKVCSEQDFDKITF